MIGTPDEHTQRLQQLNHNPKVHTIPFGDGKQVIYSCPKCKWAGRVYLPRNVVRAPMYGRLELDYQCEKAQHDLLTAFLNLWRRR